MLLLNISIFMGKFTLDETVGQTVLFQMADLIWK